MIIYNGHKKDIYQEVEFVVYVLVLFTINKQPIITLISD